MNLEDIIVLILFLLSIGVGSWYLFGDSPTFEQTIIVFLLSVLFSISLVLE